VAAPGGTGAIGPFPDGSDTDEQREEYDKLRRRVLWTLPYGLYVVGSRAGDRRNFMTLNWSTVR
jgi:flavin reductase (DIM6/NTAB) family NADH-FMN oxidoreductase RutF